MPDPQPRWALILHGGAKTIKPDLFDRNREGCLAAAAAGALVLREGGSAVRAVEEAVRRLEDNPVFNAGLGSVLNSDGADRERAAVHDRGIHLDRAVAGVRRIRNPVGAARAMLNERPVLLAGEGAERFAADHGIALCDPAEMIAKDAVASEYSKAHDTVGCVALDMQGSIAAATSTGGLPGKHPGRIGDSPVPGSGFYADDRLGGTAFSGDGESILRTMLAAHVMYGLESGTVGPAAAGAIARLGRVGGEAGAIVIDRAGRFGIAHNSDHFALALDASWLDTPRAALTAADLKDVLDG